MKRCDHPACENEGRYLNGLGQHLCGIHDALSGWASVRTSDLPLLVRHVAAFLQQAPKIENIEPLKEIVCLKKRNQ
jgi:hypothetical protein